MLACEMTPQLRRFLEKCNGVAHFDRTKGVLELLARPSGEEMALLRACQPGDESWVSRLDLVLDQREVSQLSKASAYPPTRWSLLLVGLGSDEDRAWREFMETYRRPIRMTLGLLERGYDHSGGADESLAEQYFNWLFEKQGYRKLRRLGEGGRVHRFRGWLKRSLKYFLKDTHRQSGREQRLEGSDALDIEDCDHQGRLSWIEEVDSQMDAELTRDFVRSTLEVLRRDEHSTWRVLMALLDGQTLGQIASMLALDGETRGSSISSAGRERVKAIESFRSWLVRFRLGPGCVTQEDAELEFVELSPQIAAALEEYREEQKATHQ